MLKRVFLRLIVFGLDKLISNSVENVHQIAKRAYLKGSLGDFEEALDDINIALELNPDYKDALHLKAEVLLRSGKIDDAETWISKALSLAPSNAESHAIRGEILRAKGNKTAALEAYEHALALDSTNQLALSGKGKCLE